MFTSDFVNSSLRLINAFSPGENGNPDEIGDGKQVLNQLLDNWNVQGITIYTIQNRTATMTASKQSYTMGTGGDIPVARPVKIQSAGVLRNGVRSELTILNSTQWALKRSKSALDIIPEFMWNSDDYPLTTLWFVPVPNDGACTLDLWVWDELNNAFNTTVYGDLAIDAVTNTKLSSAASPFTSADVNNYVLITGGNGFTPQRVKILSVTGGVATCSAALGTLGSTLGLGVYDELIDFPPGYFKAIRYNLAVDLAAEYGRAVPQEVVMIAQASKAELASINTSNDFAVDPKTVPPQATPQAQQNA